MTRALCWGVVAVAVAGAALLVLALFPFVLAAMVVEGRVARV